MHTLSSLVMNRHAVLSRVVKDGTEYQILIFTKRQDAADIDNVITWHDQPRGGFLTESDALRHAHYILLGISGVRENGEPIFGVT